MPSSDVRSIESLKRLRAALLSLSGDWDEVLRQIRFTAHRIQEYFGSQRPVYWSQQTAKAEASLAAALDNLSRLQAGGSGATHPATEAQQRVNIARRRLVHCQEMQMRAKRVALTIEESCQRLAGPVAEVSLHAEVNLPRAAAELAMLIDHLSRYAEVQPSPKSTGGVNDSTGGGS